MNTKILDAYTDGSFNGKNASWAFIIIEDNKIITQQKGILTGDINSMWQIGGEITAAEKAVEWARQNNVKVNIHYDYTGIENWATRKWKAKNTHTQYFRDFMDANSQCINSYVKVKAHSDNLFNNFVDELAKI